MAGTKSGAAKAANTNKQKYGDDFYAKIGAKSWDNPDRSHETGFAKLPRNVVVELGRKGGKQNKGKTYNVSLIPVGGLFAKVDKKDYAELSKYKWHLHSEGYATRTVNDRKVLMHRQIMQPPEGLFVDHINHDVLDNRRTNLRVCTHKENTQNRVFSEKADVSFYQGKWQTAVQLNGIRIYLGRFNTRQEAVEAAITYKKENTNLEYRNAKKTKIDSPAVYTKGDGSKIGDEFTLEGKEYKVALVEELTTPEEIHALLEADKDSDSPSLSE